MRRNSRVSRLAAIGIAAALLALHTGSPLLQEGQKLMRVDREAASLIPALTGVRLPPGSDIRYFDRHRGGDPMMRAKIAMSETAFEAMLADNGWAREKFTPANRDFLGSDNGDWDPGARPAFPVLVADPADTEALFVGYAPEAEGLMVYLYWFRP
jgi:hypothetical protein